MRLNFIPTLQYNPLLVAGAIAGSLQSALGIVQAISGGKKTQKLNDLRQAYLTPDEIFKILQATENMQGGYDPQTLSYLTGQTDRAFGSSLNAATMLGADPNQLSAIFDQKIQATMKIGAENHLQNIRNFDKYISALGLVADNRAAEQKSQQDIIKDKLQAASADKQAGLQNIAGGINTGIATISAAQTMNLYKEQNKSIEDLLKILNPRPGVLAPVGGGGYSESFGDNG